MRKFLITILILISTKLVFADCSGKPVALTFTDTTILVESEYVVDGVTVTPNDIKTYFPTTLVDKTEEAILDIVKADIQKQCESLIYSKYQDIKGTPVDEVLKGKLQQIQDTVQKIIKDFPDTEEQKQEATFKIDTDQDGNFDQEWRVKTDGTKTVTDISPEPINK